MKKQEAVLSQGTSVPRGMGWGFLGIPIGLGWSQLSGLSKLTLAAGLIFTTGLVSLFIGVSLSLALVAGFGAIVTHKLLVDDEPNFWEKSKVSLALKTSFEQSIIKFDLAMKERGASVPWLQRPWEETVLQSKTEGSIHHVLHQQENRIIEDKNPMVSTADDSSNFELIIKHFDEYELVFERTRHKLKNVSNVVTGTSNEAPSYLGQKTLLVINDARLFSKRTSVVMECDREGDDFIVEKTKP